MAVYIIGRKLEKRVQLVYWDVFYKMKDFKIKISLI